MFLWRLRTRNTSIRSAPRPRRAQSKNVVRRSHLYEPQYPLFFLDGSLSELSGMSKCLVPVLSTGDVRLPIHLPLGSLVMEPIIGLWEIFA